MTPEIAQKLREPFPPEHVGKLPRVWCGACREATKANRRQSVCDQHRMVRCDACHNRLTDAHLHLDYVGHAETTDRLLAADPEWTWEPLALVDGLPAFDRNGGLWIRLTVAGTTRLGYGSAEGKTGPDAVKETIGDALRNAAMRFGVALDLWGAKFKDDEPESAEPRPDPHEKAMRRRSILAAAKKEIQQATEREGLEEIRDRIGRAVDHAAITEADALELRRIWVKRMDELFPQATPQAQEPPQAEQTPEEQK